MAAKAEIHLVRNWDAAWSALVRPWLAAPASLRRDHVVVPTRGQAHGLKLRCVRENVPLLGVEFLTAGLARQKALALAAPARPVLGRELLLFNLRSLLEERLAPLVPEDPAWGMWKSLQSDVERALDDYDALLQAGRSAADFPLPPVREIFAALEARVAEMGYDFAARLDRTAAVGGASLGGRLLLTGFSCEHGRHLAALVALARRVESVTVLLPAPEFGRTNEDERWIDTWERELGVGAEVLDAPEPNGVGPQAAALWLDGTTPTRPAGVAVGVTRADEMQAVADHLVRRLAGGADNLAVIFPRAGAAHLRLARLLQERGIPFNDLLEATAPPPVDLQLQCRLLQFHERGARLEELLELWPLLHALGHTDLPLGEARDVVERIFDQTQTHALAAALPMLAARNRPDWQEVARIAGLLLPLWPARLSLGEALQRFDELATRFRLPDFGVWPVLRAYAERDRRQLALKLVVATLASFLPETGAATGVPGRGQFAPVTLTTWRRATSLGWSDVIFTESNAGVWPERLEGSCWLTDDQRESINRQHPRELGLPTGDSRAHVERQGLAAIARATRGSILFSAALFDAADPELRLAPNPWLERVMLNQPAVGSGLEESFAALARQVPRSDPPDPAGAHWFGIWQRRRDSTAPFDDFFLSGDPAVTRPEALTARLIEAGLRDPAALWFEGVLQLHRVAWSPLVRTRRLTLGSLVHQVLAKVLRGPPAGHGFSLLPQRDEAESVLAAEMESWRERWPADRYWDSFHAELAEVARALLDQVYRLSAGPFVATEANLPAGTRLQLPGSDAGIGLVGRMDLVLSDRPEWRGATVDVVDFKTGADAKLSAAAMARGSSLQLGLYLAATQTLGTAGGRVWMLKPDHAKAACLTTAELPAALAGLAQLGRHLETGRYGALTVDRTDFSHGWECPIASAPIAHEVLARKFAATFGAPATREAEVEHG